MNKTEIPWVKNPEGTPGYTLNQITGCLNCTPEGLCRGGMFPCYAYKLAHTRLRERYLANNHIHAFSGGGTRLTIEQIDKALADPFYPRFWRKKLSIPFGKPKGIFVCDMGELFGDWIPMDWQEMIFAIIRVHSQHRFYLLTKQPQNLVKFSPYPPNCWVGVTATDFSSLYYAVPYIAEIEAKVKYISFEPSLESMMSDSLELITPYLQWLIIGSCTGTKKDMETLIARYPELTLMPWGKKWTAQPKIEQVQEIVRAADKAGVKVFLKNNLKPLLCSTVKGHDVIESHQLWAFKYFKLRQELP